MRKTPAVIAGFANFRRRCVRQAAGRGRLAACAPRSLFPTRSKKRGGFVLARAGSQRQPHPERLEPPTENGIMLFRENLRRRHEGGLRTGFHDQQNSRNRHHGFSRADVALEEPVHRVTRGQVSPQFFDDAFLSRSQIERQSAEESLHQPAGRRMRLAGSQSRLRSPRAYDQLHLKKLRQNEMLACSLALSGRRREMDLVEGMFPRPKIHAFRQQGWDRVGREVLQRLKNHSAQNALGEPLGCRINRSDPTKMDRHLFVIFDHLEFRMLHAESRSAQTSFAKNNHPLTGGDHLLHVMKIEPAEDNRLTERVRILFFQSRLEDLFPSPETNDPGLNYRATNANRRFTFFARKSGELGPVLIPPWEMSQKIFHRFDFEPPERG